MERTKNKLLILLAGSVFIVVLMINLVSAFGPEDCEGECRWGAESDLCHYYSCEEQGLGESLGGCTGYWLAGYYYETCCPANSTKCSNETCCADDLTCCNADSENARCCVSDCCDTDGDSSNGDECNNMDADGDCEIDGCCEYPNRVRDKYSDQDGVCTIEYGEPDEDGIACPKKECVDCISGDDCADPIWVGGSPDYLYYPEGCCHGECYDKSSAQCCESNKCHPKTCGIAETCCDTDWDGLDDSCCGPSKPFCSGKYQLVGDQCIALQESTCAECQTLYDCNLGESCCQTADGGECYDPASEVCCGVGHCKKVESRSSWPVESGGICYRPITGCNGDVAPADSVPSYYRKLTCDSVNCIVGTLAKTLYDDATSACDGTVPSTCFKGNIGSPLGSFSQPEESSYLDCRVSPLYPNPQTVSVNWNFGNGEPFSYYVGGGVGMFTRTKTEQTLLGYVEEGEEGRGRGRGGGSGRPGTQPVFGSVESSSLSYDPMVTGGIKFKIFDRACHFSMYTNMKNVGWQVGVNLFKINEWLDVEAVYVQPPTGEADGGAVIGLGACISLP